MPRRRNHASAPPQELRHAGAPLIAQHLDVGQARGIIDGHVYVLPPDAPHAVAAIARDPMADAADAAAFLDVQVQQLPDVAPFVALDGRLGLEALERAKPRRAISRATVLRPRRSWAAISALVHRCRRSWSMCASNSGGVAVGLRWGRHDRSRRSAAVWARSTQRRAVLAVTWKVAATRLTLCPSCVTRRTISARLHSVVRAF
jgi:hypothetical protein